MQRLGKWLVMVGLVFSLGLHWALLQSAAWVGMTIRYAQDGSLTQALAMTFDGKHPCSLCHFVSAGRQAEKENEQPQNSPLVLKIDFFFEAPARFLFAARPAPGVTRLATRAVARAEAPPVPPPRSA